MSELEEPLQEDFNEPQRTELTVTHKQMMDEAWDSLTGNWGLAILTYVIYLMVIGSASAIPYLEYLLGGPFAIGLAIFSIKFARNEKPAVSNLFDGFPDFARAIGTYILMMLAIILGALCFIIPGIMLAFGLSQTFYILAEDKEIGAIDALKKSWAITDGHKMDLFILSLRFIPWILLTIFTLFIGLLWVMPWMQVTFARYYLELTNDEHREKFGEDILDHLVD